MLKQEYIEKIKVNAGMIREICDRLQSETVPATVLSQTKKMERLLLDSYCTNKRILPPLFRDKKGVNGIDPNTELAEILCFTEDSISIRLPLLAYKGTKDDMILDNDNYNIRGVINVIVLYIGSSDSGINSWYTHKTVLSDERPMGTYITITRREKNNDFFTQKK